MKPVTRLLSFLLLLLPFAAAAQHAGDIPPKPSFIYAVNDLADILNSSEQQRLEQKLEDYQKTSSCQITVVTVKSIGDADVHQFATELGERWGLGTAEKDNGVVVLAAMEEHKIAITVGRGLEGALTDIESGKIIRKEIVPRFKEEKYYEGLSAAADAIIEATKGEYTGESSGRGSLGGIGAIIITIIIIAVLLSIFGGGRGGGGYLSRRGYGGLSGGLFGSLFGGGWSSGGSSWGGGGGSSSGGGFGGFGGGGSFGGGGASGSW